MGVFNPYAPPTFSDYRQILQRRYDMEYEIHEQKVIMRQEAAARRMSGRDMYGLGSAIAGADRMAGEAVGTRETPLPRVPPKKEPETLREELQEETNEWLEDALEES